MVNSKWSLCLVRSFFGFKEPQRQAQNHLPFTIHLLPGLER